MSEFLRKAVLVIYILMAISVANSADKPLRVFFLSGQSNMVGPGQEWYLRNNRPELLLPRKDVFAIQWGVPSGPLRSGFGGRETSFGPELMFGHVLGDTLDEEVILIKAAWGGKTLYKDFRPPSAVKKRGGEVGPYYQLMMERFSRALQHLDKHVPAVSERGYELAGFVWFQGENDSLVSKAVWDEYEDNLKDLLYDVRSTLGVPKMPVMIIQINKSMWGDDKPDPKTGIYKKGGFFVREAQRKVAEADSHATWVPTKDLNQGYHYDSASHLVIGERAGKEMLQLLAKEIRDDRASPKVKAMVKTNVLDKILPPSTEEPDFDALCKGLFAYFPFDEGEGDVVVGAAVQPVKGIWSGKGKKQNVWTKGIAGNALRLKGDTFLEFPEFREPVDAKGLIGDLTVSFWYQANTRTGTTRIGRGAGYRWKRDGSNWFYSEQANYAGWDVSHFDIDGTAFFTTSFHEIGPRARIGAVTPGDGIKWTHIVATYKRATGDMWVWVDGERYPKPRKNRRKPKKLVPIDPLTKGGYGIIPANVPLYIGVDKLENPAAYASFDELCMWRRTLSDKEIQILYNNGHGISIPVDKVAAPASGGSSD